MMYIVLLLSICELFCLGKIAGDKETAFIGTNGSAVLLYSLSSIPPGDCHSSGDYHSHHSHPHSMSTGAENEEVEGCCSA